MKIAICIPFRSAIFPRAAASWLAAFIGAFKDHEPSLNVCYRSHVQQARREIMESALNNGADWLLWVDDDAVLPNDVFPRLWAARYQGDVIVPWFTTRDGGSVTWRLKEAEGGLLDKDGGPMPWQEEGRQIHMTGFHCILMNRHTAESVWRVTNGNPFVIHPVPNGWVGEDCYFFQHAYRAGIRVWQEPSIKVGHIGEVVV